MTTTAAVTPLQADTPTPRLRSNQIHVKGRLVGLRKAGKSIAHFVIIPAPDAYSHPNNLMFFSERREGEPEEDIAIICEPRGRMRSYISTDDMGEKRNVKTVDISLWAVNP